MDGREKWTAYKFTKSVYDVWMPIHLQRICSAIDQLPPRLDFQVFQPSGGVQSEEEKATGLSRDMGSLVSEPSDVDPASHIGQEMAELNPILPQTTISDTSVSRGRGPRTAANKAKKKTRTKK